MVLAVVATVIGFFTCSVIGAIPGVVSIVYSSKVNGLHNAGDVDGALGAAKSAKAWGIASLITTVVLIILGVVVFAIFAIALSSEIDSEPVLNFSTLSSSPR